MRQMQCVAGLLAGILLCAGFGAARCAEKIHLKLTSNGLESLTYAGVEYVDPTGSGIMGFNVPNSPQSGNVWTAYVVDAKKSADPFTPVPTATVLQGNTIIKSYPWGSLTANYLVKDADLYVTATITNTSTTPIGWWKANLLQFNSRLLFDNKPWGEVMPYGYTPNMHWDYRWAMWGGGSDPYQVWNFTDPHVYWWVDRAAPFDNAPVKIMFADLDPKWQTGVSHVKTEHGDAWPVVAAANGDPGGAPQVAPGQSDTAHIVIRFRQRAPADPAAVTKTRQHLLSLEQQVAAAKATLQEAKKKLEHGADQALEAAPGEAPVAHTDVKANTAAVHAAEEALAARQTELAQAQAAQKAAEASGMPSALDVCADGYEAFGRAYPRTVCWTDRRPIGTYFGCRGNGRSASNPNGWFGDPKVDTTTPEGRNVFATRLLADIDSTITVLTNTGAQGVLWWDVEGARWPQPITYIGDPRVLDPAYPQHDKFDPELDTPVTYHGQQMKLVDACFKKWQDAGFKTGVTIRPQTLVCKDTPQQTNQSDALADNLCAKATYARERWGCTIFYIDSINEWFGNWWMEKTVKKYSDVLLMPEWARTRSYRHSSQFSYTRFTGFTRGVPAEMQACWPDAFCCMGNVDFEKNYDDALYAVRHGNLLLFNCWYQSSEASKIKQIYQTTGIRHTPRALDQQVTTPRNSPLKITLRASDEDGNTVSYTILGPPAHGVLGVLDAVTGVITYTPAPGYTGKDSFSFTATDTTGLRANRGIVEIVVNEK